MKSVPDRSSYQALEVQKDCEAGDAPAVTPDSSKRNKLYLVSLVSIVVAAIALFGLLADVTIGKMRETTPSDFDARGRYILKSFDEGNPMSSFLPGLGGLWGIPLWAFYVNRGQAITSFGIQNKDQPIMKFYTAEKAYQNTPFVGFRTFIKGTRAGKSFEYMPFFPETGDQAKKPSRDMMIGMNELEIEEKSEEMGLKTNIMYFTLCDEEFPALVRQTTITNTDKNPVSIEVLDGLARVIPSGLSNGAIDNMGRTMEAWMNVYNTGRNGIADGGITHPFFHISQGTADTAKVQVIKDGHFALSFTTETHRNSLGDESTSTTKLLPFIVDPSLVFLSDTTLTSPRGFFGPKGFSTATVAKMSQGTTSRTPCAFSASQFTIPPGKNVTITSFYGHAENLEKFISDYSPKLRSKGFVERKLSASDDLIDLITTKVETKTGLVIFDAYVKQSFLDNVLRGGLPMILGDADDPKIYHTFSRIHGDIERDYNFFQIDTTYFSQGPGNFRDVNQNRRLDVFHTPEVGDYNVRTFMSFVQADAYNPLTVANSNFKIDSSDLDEIINSIAILDDEYHHARNKMRELLMKPFRIGQLFQDMKQNNIVTNLDKMIFINKLVSYADQVPAAQYAQNGFWADHWTYLLDLVENYNSVYPDREQHLLWDSPKIPFFMSPAIVRPRSNRYTAIDDPVVPGQKTMRAYGAVSAWGDHDFPMYRESELNGIYSDPNYVADIYGNGGIWQRTREGKPFTVTIASKLFLLAMIKFSTLDPYGMGIEMEGGKPGWNDAMNGLPGLMGSGMPETYELLRLVRYLHKTVKRFNRSIEISSEFKIFVDSIMAAITTPFNGNSGEHSPEHLFVVWDKMNTAREVYRASVVGTFIGTYESLNVNDLMNIFTTVENKIQQGIERALKRSPTRLSPTYFSYSTKNFNVISNTPLLVMPKSFEAHDLPYFLEGPTRQLKIVESVQEKRNIYLTVKRSTLYDAALKMYTMSESLASASQEIGRAKAFSAGWLENQSIWLHMSYKFYLELLKGQLYDEFFSEIQTGLVPFMNHAVYGRSPLEATSFIVPSCFPDDKIHGTGFLARLSGSTAEFLSMWAIMMSGHEPFYLNANGDMELQLNPILPGWLFGDDGIVSFTFLGSTIVTYHNPNKYDTWTVKAKSSLIVDDSGNSFLVTGSFFEPIWANRIRDGHIESIEVYYEDIDHSQRTN